MEGETRASEAHPARRGRSRKSVDDHGFSCVPAVVVAQQATEALPTSKPAFSTAHLLPGFQDVIVQTLMVPFLVIMGQELAHGADADLFDLLDAGSKQDRGPVFARGPEAVTFAVHLESLELSFSMSPTQD